jgi:predicted nucleotide-binding protein
MSIVRPTAPKSAADTPATQVKQGKRIFIGHGHSPAWRELKDFIVERLKLPYDEFNAVSAAGATNVERLSEMLDNAAFAFLVLTAEDEQASGKMQARMNVVHEAGLFQGRLGFKKAIILLEDGCDEFSNIKGLVHIPFPPSRISSSFEEVRRVLEREGIIQP